MRYKTSNKNQKHKTLHDRYVNYLNMACISILIILLTPLAYAPSVGVIPTEINLGNVNRGEDVAATLYLSTASNNILKFSGSYINPVSNPWFRDYISEYSEEEISGWVSFPEKVIEVDGSKSFEVNIGGVNTRANKKVEFIIHIPKNAEPGYHVGSINFFPITEQGKGAEVTMYALIRPNFVFRVNGAAIRSGTITKINAERLSKNKARIIITFKNTGTNTMGTDTRNSFVKIYNDNNEIRAELPLSGLTVRPGEERNIGVEWYSSEEIKDGKYKVFATINYKNDETSKSEFVTIPSMITVAKVVGSPIDIKPDTVDAIPTGGTCSINWTLILILSLLAGLIIYWRMERIDILGILLITIGVFVGVTIIYYFLACYRNIWSIIIFILIGSAIYYWKKP